jgi:hypothetical protein
MSLKLDSVLNKYDGREPWTHWFEKFVTVAEFMGWTDVDRLRYLVLYLDGVPARIYRNLKQKDRTLEVVNKKFLDTFAPGPLEAHSKLIGRRIRSNESVEELWYELVELWKIQTQQTLTDVEDEVEFKSVLPFFMAALPESISTQLKMAEADKELSLLLTKARTLVGIQQASDAFAIGAVNTRGNSGKAKKKYKCFRCGELNHMVERCPYTTSVCFTCKQPNHRSADCPKNGQGAGFQVGVPPRRR